MDERSMDATGMKLPLLYQTTNYDCGPTAVLNAIRFLYDREQIPPEFVHKAFSCMLDRSNGECVFARGGTTNAALRYYAQWLNIYARDIHYNIRTYYIEGDKVNMREGSLIRKCLNMDGAVVARCCVQEDHFITLTGMQLGTEENPYDTMEYVRLFDPWYMEKPLWNDSRIQRVNDKPKEYNMLVPVEDLEAGRETWYALENCDEKCAALFIRTGPGYVIHPENDFTL